MTKDPIKKADNGTYYFRANLGYHPVTGKQIQKYRSGFATKKEARAEYSKLILASAEQIAEEKECVTFKKFINEIYLPWYKTQVKEVPTKTDVQRSKSILPIPTKKIPTRLNRFMYKTGS